MCNRHRWAHKCAHTHTHTLTEHMSITVPPPLPHTFCRMTFLSYMILWGSNHKFKFIYSFGKCLSCQHVPVTRAGPGMCGDLGNYVLQGTYLQNNVGHPRSALGCWNFRGSSGAVGQARRTGSCCGGQGGEGGGTARPGQPVSPLGGDCRWTPLPHPHSRRPRPVLRAHCDLSLTRMDMSLPDLQSPAWPSPTVLHRLPREPAAPSHRCLTAAPGRPLPALRARGLCHTLPTSSKEWFMEAWP